MSEQRGSADNAAAEDVSWMRIANWRLKKASTPPSYHQATLSGGTDEEALLLFPELTSITSAPSVELAEKVKRLDSAVRDWSVACTGPALAQPPSDAATDSATPAASPAMQGQRARVPSTADRGPGTRSEPESSMTAVSARLNKVDDRLTAMEQLQSSRDGVTMELLQSNHAMMSRLAQLEGIISGTTQPVPASAQLDSTYLSPLHRDSQGTPSASPLAPLCLDEYRSELKADATAVHVPQPPPPPPPPEAAGVSRPLTPTVCEEAEKKVEAMEEDEMVALQESMCVTCLRMPIACTRAPNPDMLYMLVADGMRQSCSEWGKALHAPSGGSWFCC